MSATEELRRLLDERGVEWSSIGGDTAWFDSRGWTVETVADDVDGTMLHVMTLMTPVQAVEATLGRETCRMEHVKDGPCYDVWRCSACGYEYAENVSMDSIVQNFCPNCGREVVE